MSNYYYLIAGLPELTLDDSKLSYNVADFKEELYDNLSDSDKKIIDLFYLKFDNANTLKLLQDKEAEIDPRGNYSAEEIISAISAIKEGDKPSIRSFPSYLIKFISLYFDENNSGENDPVWYENSLAALYYDYGMRSKNEFVSSWFEFNFNLNNILAALTARKYKVNVSENIVGDTELTESLKTSGARDFGLTNEVEYFDQLVKISETDELLEREKKIDLLRWNWIDEAIFFKYFSVEQLFAFLVKLEMIERWLSLDKERGKELFREIIDSLRDDVQIPSEFSK